LSTADTKTRLLDAAERLFAEDGFAATSFRDITGEAGVNGAAVHYHFGSKEGLLREVFARRLAPVNRARLDRLAAVRREAAERPPRVLDVVRALIEPAFAAMREAGEDGERFMRLVGRTHSETRDQVRACFLEQFRDVHEAFLEAFSRALPGIERLELVARYHFAIGAMAHTLTWLRKIHAAGGLEGLDDAETLREALVRFAAAGMAAPAPGRPS
jgi:AcrR family transcriptional regulator